MPARWLEEQSSAIRDKVMAAQSDIDRSAIVTEREWLALAEAL